MERFGPVPWSERYAKPDPARRRFPLSTPEEQQRRRQQLVAAMAGEPDA